MSDDGIEDGREETSRSSWGLWAAVCALTGGAFAAGFLVGVVSDGNAAMINEFKAKNTSASVVASGPEPTMPTPMPSPSPSKAMPDAARRPNNQVDWAISIAPGTNVAPVDVRTADLDADTRMEFGAVYGTQVSPVATLWIRSGSAARIVLPMGTYSIRTTRIPTAAKEGSPVPEPTIVDGTMNVARADPSMTTASVAGNRTGTWRISQPTGKAVDKDDEKAVPVKRKRTPAKDTEYEGLGEDAKTGGASTYEG